MAYTEEQILAAIATLESAFVRGEKRVEFADRMVEYSSAAELRERIEYFRGLLPSVATLPGRSKQTLAVSSKGF